MDGRFLRSKFEIFAKAEPSMLSFPEIARSRRGGILIWFIVLFRDLSVLLSCMAFALRTFEPNYSNFPAYGFFPKALFFLLCSSFHRDFSSFFYPTLFFLNGDCFPFFPRTAPIFRQSPPSPHIIKSWKSFLRKISANFQLWIIYSMPNFVVN